MEGYQMSHGDTSNLDLEALQRWAIVVDDQLREAADAVITLEDPKAGPICDGGDLFNSGRSNADLASDLIEEINAYRESRDRPAWFTPASQMVLVVSTWAEFLTDYVAEITEHGAQPNDKQFSLIVERIEPAIRHFDRFLKAVRAAGYL
jgi:hypothetical protein